MFAKGIERPLAGIERGGNPRQVVHGILDYQQVLLSCNVLILLLLKDVEMPILGAPNMEKAEISSPYGAWRLCVAPMVDWTDTHCRVFHRLLSPHARVYTEMLHANAVLHGDPARILDFDAGEHPVALQLGGSEPALLAAATKRAVAWGYDEVNLNVGCPSERVQSGSFGACLMREPALVADCVAAMVDASLVPVTVKCRIGVDEQEPREVLFDFAQRMKTAGAAALIVHARKAWLSGLNPKENREIPPLDYPLVHELKRQHEAWPIVINGGIATRESAVAQLQHMDGVMIGRAAYHEPYLLHRLDRDLFANAAPLQTRIELLRQMRPYVDARLADGVPLKHIVRHVLGLFHGQAGGRAFRQVISTGAHRQGADWSLVERALDAVELHQAAA